MALLKLFKSLAALPGSLVANAVYLVRTGAGFDLYATDTAGAAFPLNAVAGAVGTAMGSWNLPGVDSNLFPIATWFPPGNATTVPAVIGFQAFTAITAGTARTVATTNAGTRIKRLGFPTSAATAGLLAGVRLAVAQFTLGATPVGGFIATTIFGCGDAATVAGARQFCGITSNTAAPTNVEPSTLLNCIGAGHGAADANLKVYTAGSAVNAAIDLGANFPISTLNSADMYRLTVYAPKDPGAAGYKAAWHVQRLGTAFSASGILTGAAGTTVPATTTLLTFNSWRTNNATALAAVLDVGATTLQQLG